jgi:glycosyltransferase involved in cell wall biosynthesis
MEMARPALSLVMPAYNEAGNIERAVRAAAAAGEKAGTYEVVVVDDGSRDATRERLAALEAEMGARLRVVRHEKNRGLRGALRSGFAPRKATSSSTPIPTTNSTSPSWPA